MRYFLAACLLALFILAWQGVASLHSVDDLTLASPIETWGALRDDWSLLMDNFGTTLVEVVLGLAIATVAGVIFAVSMHLFRALRDAAYPLLVASQAIPIVVLAPIFILAFDYGIGPKLAIVALICFFPVTVTTLDALASVDPDAVKLLRTLDASRWQVFRYLEAPAALPGLLSGAKIAVAVAVIGAVLAEQAGSSNGLGHLLLQAIPQLETPRAYAAVVLLAAFAVALFSALALAERRLVPWANRRPEGPRA